MVCAEEIALMRGWILAARMAAQAKGMRWKRGWSESVADQCAGEVSRGKCVCRISPRWRDAFYFFRRDTRVGKHNFPLKISTFQQLFGEITPP